MIPPRVITALSAVVAAFLCSGGHAWAHQSSISYLELDITRDQRHATLGLLISADDLFEALSLDRDRTATDQEIVLGSDALHDYVGGHLTVIPTGSEGCSFERSPVEVVGLATGRFAKVHTTLACPQVLSKIELDYDLFFDLDPLHNCALTATFAGERASVILSNDENRFEWELGDPPPSGFLGFLVSGGEHILYGFDHILFLVSLLLMAVITRADDGWRLRRPGEGFKYLLTIVTSFTIAHSITLVSAALGVIPIHPRIVESIIAASIIYVAVENAVRPDPPRRYLVTFAFGLLHGLGFASMLRELLPSEGLVVPVIAFNLGVEVGQLLIVAVLFPLLLALGSRLGAAGYRRRILVGGAIALSLLGGTWLIERVFDLPLLDPLLGLLSSS